MGNETGSQEGGTLVLFPGALGDAVCVEPAIAWLGQFGPICFYARGGAAEVADFFPARPRVGSLDDAMISGLFAPPEVTNPELWHWLAQFRRVVSFTGSKSPHFRERLRPLSHAKVLPFPHAEGSGHAVDEMLAGVSGGRAASGAIPALEVLPALARPPSLPAAAGPCEPMGAPTLLLHPGSGGAAKRAPRELFDGLARLWGENPGGSVVLLLGPTELAERPWWTARFETVLCPASLRELVAVVGSGDVYFGNDAGPSHVAAGLGVPTLVWFQSTSPDRFGPRGARVGYLSSNSPDASIAGVHRCLKGLLA